MLVIADTLISDDVVTERFMCNIEACKAACCVEGDLGAPLEESETVVLEEIYPHLEPFLTDAGKKAILDQGKWVLDADGDWSTPTIAGRECAYASYDETGILKCGIELAWEAGKVNFRKPTSCHLYPIRVKKHHGFTAVNYHRWHICAQGCALGERLGTPVFRFLKEALITRFGAEWYAELEVLADYQGNRNSKSNP